MAILINIYCYNFNTMATNRLGNFNIYFYSYNSNTMATNRHRSFNIYIYCYKLNPVATNTHDSFNIYLYCYNLNTTATNRYGILTYIFIAKIKTPWLTTGMTFLTFVFFRFLLQMSIRILFCSLTNVKNNA